MVTVMEPPALYDCPNLASEPGKAEPLIHHSSRRHRFLEAKLHQQQKDIGSGSSTCPAASNVGSGHRERWRLSRLRGDSPHDQVHDQDEPPAPSDVLRPVCDVNSTCTSASEKLSLTPATLSTTTAVTTNNPSNSSSSSTTATPLRVGFYEIERTIGRGNFAVVKLARHRITKTEVSLFLLISTETIN